MELPELLSKEAEIKDKIEKLNKRICDLNKELGVLYNFAIDDGFVWDSTEQKWYKDVQ